jgi:CubicO group peptidase (beta-lactamase class C family)
LETETAKDAYDLVTTARDLARFGHLFLSRGRANGERVVAPATIDAMLRNHVSGLGLQFEDEEWPTVEWGLGWHIRGDSAPRRGPSLGSPRTVDHPGHGGSHLWIDPEAEVVGVALSLLREGAAGFYPGWRSDLLANAVLAAIE